MNEKPTAADMTEEEAAAAFGEEEAEEQAEPGGVAERIKNKIAGAESIEGVPGFASLPPGFTIPPGKRCGWMLFRAEWTDAPEKGDRWCMVWNLSEAEEKIALKKSQGDAARTLAEMTKAGIRLIDGVAADRTGRAGPGNVNAFFAEIGGKCRGLLQNYHMKAHTLSAEEQADFFANCFEVTVATAG